MEKELTGLDMTVLLPSPSDLLGAGDFISWYPGQYQLLEQGLSWLASPARFLGIAAPTGSGKTISALLLAKLSEQRTIILTATKGLQAQYCVAPETRILTADLRWVRAGSVHRDDVLMGFDEYPSGKDYHHAKDNIAGRKRKWRSTVVESVSVVELPSYRLSFADGTVVTCSAKHKWLVKQHSTSEWVRTDKLVCGGRGRNARVVRLLDVWEDFPRSYGYGYLAGALDGEGCLMQAVPANGNGFDVKLTFTQRDNEMLRKFTGLLTRFGFEFSCYCYGPRPNGWRDVTTVDIRSRASIMRLLGQARPVRLLAKFDPDKMGAIARYRETVLVDKVDVGVTRLMAIKTASRTFVAEGLASHNCNDASLISGVSVVGQGNFPCILVNGLTADDGPCHDGLSCPVRAQCPYRVQLNQALESNLVITNYAYWLAQTNFSSGLGDVGLLVCVPGETLVTLSDGSYRRISDIVENKRRLFVKSMDLSTGLPVDSCISGWHRVECKVRLLRIQTIMGFLDVTEDHQVWTQRGYVAARDVVRGDTLYDYSMEPRTANTREPARRWLSDAWEKQWGEPEIYRKAMSCPEGICRVEEESVGRLGKQGTRAGTQWWLGDGLVCVPNAIDTRVGTVLPIVLPRREEDNLSGVVGLGGYPRTGLVVYGRWIAGSETLPCIYINARLRRIRECSDIFVAARCIRYRDYNAGGQSRERILPRFTGERPRSIIRPDWEVYNAGYGIQSDVYHSNDHLCSVWPPVSSHEERAGLLPRVPRTISAGMEQSMDAREAEVLSIQEVERPKYVYDITVAGTHNFFANNYLVRNCDESHQAFGSMENYLTIFLSRLDLQPIGINFPESADHPESADQWNVWQSWAEASTPTARENMAKIEQDVKTRRQNGQTVPNYLSRAYRSARGVLARLERLSTVGEQWVIQRTYHGYRFVPKWVANYSSHLFHDVPKVVLMSAILSHRSADYLGVPNGDSRSWVEMNSYFPAANTPIWHIPTARINYRTDDFGSTIWCSRIDQIIQRRLDRKGIVFTVSYERAKMLLSRSRFKDIMVTHSTGDVVQVVEKFKQMAAPAVLVSPSVTTGWDFPGNGKPQYLIVGKVPYPDTKDPVTQARHEEDKEWTSYLAMETLIQECGRMTRSSEDKTEVFLIDNSAVWFMRIYGKFAPHWFMSRYKGIMETVPDPLFW